MYTWVTTFFMCVLLFSSPHLYPDLSRRKCSNGSVFPGEPSGADDPLWQTGEQEGDRLFVHLQGGPGCAAAWGGGVSCQGEEGKVFKSNKTHSTSLRLDLSIFVNQEHGLTLSSQPFLDLWPFKGEAKSPLSSFHRLHFRLNCEQLKNYLNSLSRPEEVWWSSVLP